MQYFLQTAWYQCIYILKIECPLLKALKQWQQKFEFDCVRIRGLREAQYWYQIIY